MTDIKVEDYGPLTGLIGTWVGDKGMDVAPEPDGTEKNPYYETINFEAIGELTNAESQCLTAIHYRQIVRRKSNQQAFHDETGYWMWDAKTQTVMQSLMIPRAVGVLAGARYDATKSLGDDVVLEVSAKIDDPDWGIIQSSFMRDNARTIEFHHKITVGGGKLFYAETTMVDIYGKLFEHTDQNELTLI